MRILPTCLVLALSILPACLEVEQTIVLGPDGSGKQTVRMKVRETTLQDLERKSQAASAGAGFASAVFDKELVGKELAAAGLGLESHQAERKGAMRSVDLVATFPNFAALQKSPLVGSSAQWELTAGPQADTVKLTLYPQGKQAWTDARAKAESMAKEMDVVAEAFFRKKQTEIAGLDLTVRFQLPGDVYLHTANLEKTGPREVTARITADQIKTPQDLVRRLAPRFEVVFDGKGCKLPLQ
ncbi:MAG: hypothetical protein JNK15_08915 [Planctomycetes bacterium]|nr:hypothetical protein [Planctomycetota bacterium]